jgi:hypothetical protein
MKMPKFHTEKISPTPKAQQPLVGQGLLIIEALRSHSRHITLGKTLLGEGSVRRRDLYLTTHNTQNGQTPMPPAGFEPTSPKASDHRTTL